MSKKEVVGKNLTKIRQAESVFAEEIYCFDMLKKMRRVLVMAITASVIAMVIAFLAWTTRPRAQYLVIQDGKILQDKPITQAINNSDQVATWTSNQLQEIFTFDFVHYRDQIESHKMSFTHEGWIAFLKALKDSKLPQSVKEERQVVSSIPTSAPRVMAEGVFNGRYAWKIEQDFLLTFYTGNVSQTQNIKMNVLVVRVPTYENPSGVGIQQLIQIAK